MKGDRKKVKKRAKKRRN